MPKKKPQRNAFYFYMQDVVMPQMRRDGRFTGMESVVPVAHPMWKALPPHEKAIYENMAKEYKARMRGQEGDNYRLDNIGNVIANRKNPLEELRKRKQKERVEFTQKWSQGNEVINDKFYFIDFRTLCKTEEGDYLPVEVGLVEFTLKNGIRKTYHTFIDPGPIPLGYRFECQNNSDQTHKIPVEGFDLAERNYRSIWIQLENFVNPGGESSYYPPLFCPEEKVEEVEYCIGWLHSHACLGIPNRLNKISHLEIMVQELFKHIGKSPPSEGAISNTLTTSAFDYDNGVMCAWHEEIENNFCALGTVRIYSFALADAMTSQYEIELTKNHLPARSLEPVCTVIRPTIEPDSGSSWQRNKGQRREEDRNGRFPARDFRETDKAWQQAQQKKSEPKSAPWKKPEPKEEEEERFEDVEPQLSQSLRKPKNPGIAAQIGRGIRRSEQERAPPGALGEHGTLVPQPAEVDIGQKWVRPYQHPVVAPGSIVYSNGQQKPPSRSEEDEWPSLGAAPAPKGPKAPAPNMGQPAAIPKFAGRAGPPPAQQAPQPPPAWSNGQGLASMQDVANSLTSSQPKMPWGNQSNNMLFAGIGRGRGAWSLPPGMAQPTVLPKKN